MINGVSITRLLGGISKTLEIVQKISPLYSDIKPLFKKLNTYLYRQNNLEQISDNISDNGNTNTISFFK